VHQEMVSLTTVEPLQSVFSYAVLELSLSSARAVWCPGNILEVLDERNLPIRYTIITWCSGVLESCL